MFTQCDDAAQVLDVEGDITRHLAAVAVAHKHAGGVDGQGGVQDVVTATCRRKEGGRSLDKPWTCHVT